MRANERAIAGQFQTRSIVEIYKTCIKFKLQTICQSHVFNEYRQN